MDKPKGMSSNAAVQAVKRIYRARKAGHPGSLDPLATGLLPICLGEATKIATFLLERDKRYEATAHLGVSTTTGDAEGEIVDTRPVEGLDRARIEAVLNEFTGEIQQVPPMYSALKHKGQPLYKLARQGIEIERAPRTVRVHSLKLLGFSGAQLELEAVCSRGTYIRTLVEDIGQALGCGAHVSALRRTGMGPYGEECLVSLEELEALARQGTEQLDARLLAVDSGLADWPEVVLSEDTAYYLRQGQPVIVPHAPTQGWVRLFAGHHRFVGVGQILDDGRVAPRRLLKSA